VEENIVTGIIIFGIILIIIESWDLIKIKNKL